MYRGALYLDESVTKVGSGEPQIWIPTNISKCPLYQTHNFDNGLRQNS